MEPVFEKHFTLDQANAMIPHVRRLFNEIQVLLSASNNADADKSSGQSTIPNGNGHSTNGHSQPNGNGNGHGSSEPTHSQADYTGWSDEKRHEAAYRLLNALQSQGIVIQDVERGLIDFPAMMRDGREVFLCYELSDGLNIQYFHDINAGFAGRQLITENDL